MMKIQTSDHLMDPMEFKNTYLQTNYVQNYSFTLLVTGWPSLNSNSLVLNLFVINPLIIFIQILPIVRKLKRTD